MRIGGSSFQSTEQLSSERLLRCWHQRTRENWTKSHHHPTMMSLCLCVVLPRLIVLLFSCVANRKKKILCFCCCVRPKKCAKCTAQVRKCINEKYAKYNIFNGLAPFRQFKYQRKDKIHKTTAKITNAPIQINQRYKNSERKLDAITGSHRSPFASSLSLL